MCIRDRLYPDANRDLGTNIEPLKQVIVGNVGGTLLLLLGCLLYTSSRFSGRVTIHLDHFHARLDILGVH